MVWHELIDESGHCWDGRSYLLIESLQSSLPMDQLHQFAVTNLGFVGLSLTVSGARIALRPDILTERAKATLLVRLMHDRPRRIALEWFAGDWRAELIAQPAAFARRLAALQLNRKLQETSRTAHREEIVLEAGAIRTVLDTWDSNRRLDPVLAVLHGRDDMPYLIMAGRSAYDLQIKDLGNGMISRARQWRRIALGRRFEEFPDQPYGQWVSAAYMEAAASDRPLVERVVVDIEWPSLGRKRHHYDRLILPFRHKKIVSVLSTSLSRNTLGS